MFRQEVYNYTYMYMYSVLLIHLYYIKYCLEINFMKLVIAVIQRVEVMAAIYRHLTCYLYNILNICTQGFEIKCMSNMSDDFI